MPVIESDTVIVSPDGRASLNAERLFAKPHIKESMERMREMVARLKEKNHEVGSSIQRRNGAAAIP